MNWEAVGAISQIVGAVLVGITLIYLCSSAPTEHICAEIINVPGHQRLMGSTMEVWATHSDARTVAHKSPGGARRTFS